MGISWLLYRLARLVIDGPLSLVPSFFFLAVCFPTNYGLSHHWTASFLFLLMLLCLAESVSRMGEWTARVEKGVWLAAGLLAAATLVTMQPKGAVALLLGPAYLLLAERTCGRHSWRESLRVGWPRGVWFVMGFAGVFSAAALYFAAKHAIRDWLYDNFVFLVTGYWPYVNPDGSFWFAVSHPLNSLATHPSMTYLLLALGYYFFMVVGPGAVLAGAFWCLPALRDSGNVRARLILLYVLGSSGAFVSEIHSLDLMHFVFGGILIVAVLLATGQTLFRTIPRARGLLTIGAVIIGIFVILGSAWQVIYAKKRNMAVVTKRGTVYETPQEGAALRERLDAIQSRVPEGGETFFFMYDASLYFLTATRNPTRFDNIIPDFHTPAQMDEVANALMQRRPRFIFDLSREEAPTESEMFVPHPLETRLSDPGSPYHLEPEVAAMKIWALTR